MRLSIALFGAFCVLFISFARSDPSDDMSVTWSSPIDAAAIPASGEDYYTMSEDDKEIDYAAVESVASAETGSVTDINLDSDASTLISEQDDPELEDIEEDENEEIDNDVDESEDSAAVRSLKGKKHRKATYVMPMKVAPMPMPMPSKKGYTGYPMMNGGGKKGGYGGYGGSGNGGYYGGNSGSYGNSGYYRRALKEYAPAPKAYVPAPVVHVPSKPVVAPKSSYRPVTQNYVEIATKPVVSVIPTTSYAKVADSYKGLNAATRRYLHGKKKSKHSYSGKGKQQTYVQPMKLAVVMPVATGKGGYGGGHGHHGGYGGYY